MHALFAGQMEFILSKDCNARAAAAAVGARGCYLISSAKPITGIFLPFMRNSP